VIEFRFLRRFVAMPLTASNATDRHHDEARCRSAVATTILNRLGLRGRESPELIGFNGLDGAVTRTRYAVCTRRPPMQPR
jgi:hypothetical protein